MNENQYEIQFSLSYSGSSSNNNEIDLYDVSQALIGFQRTLALTTHLILNGEIITQSPSLKGAQIFAFPAEQGSWKIKAGILIVGAAAYQLGTLPNNTPLGHLIFSAYDYLVSESTGVHVDYNKSLGKLYEEDEIKNSSLPKIREAQLDSLIEKCSVAMTEMHRPIYKTKTAQTACISSEVNSESMGELPILSFDTFQYLIEEYTEEDITVISGSISSYNSNTFKGRIYVLDEERSITFELSESIRNESTIQIVVDSLSASALRKFSKISVNLYCKVQKSVSRSGRVKNYKIMMVASEPFLD